MNVLNMLNEVELNKIFKPYKPWPISHGFHKIFGFRVRDGMYGRSVIAELENEIVYLPQYLSRKLSDEDVDSLNTCEEPIYLYFGGKNKEKNYWIVKLRSESQMMEEVKKIKKRSNKLQMKHLLKLIRIGMKRMRFQLRR